VRAEFRAVRSRNVNEKQNPGPWAQTKAALGWIAFVAAALAASVEVFLHKSRTFGERFLGIQAAAVLLIVPFYTVFWEGHDVTPLLAFLAAYVFMCLVARIGGALERRRGGPREHSHYSGYPRVMRFTGRMNERTVKLMIEPMLVLIIGIFTLPASEPLGSYLLLAGFGLSLTVNLNAGYEHRRVLDMHDAAIDQKDIVDQFRDMRGE